MSQATRVLKAHEHLTTHVKNTFIHVIESDTDQCMSRTASEPTIKCQPWANTSTMEEIQADSTAHSDAGDGTLMSSKARNDSTPTASRLYVESSDKPAEMGSCLGYTSISHVSVARGAGPERQTSSRCSEVSSPAASEMDWIGRTTVMLKNIPFNFTQEMLVDELAREGFSDAYDFLYIPVKPGSLQNRGYAFINFHRDSLVATFKQVFSGIKAEGALANCDLEVTVAKKQGFVRNWQHFKHCRVGRGTPASRPLFFSRGVEASQPHYTDYVPVHDVQTPVEEEEDCETPVSGHSKAVAKNRRFCHQCGAKLGIAYRFCASCGTKAS